MSDMPKEIWVMRFKKKYIALDSINEGTIDELSTKYYHHSVVDELANALEEIREIYAGMEGFIPQTAPEGYQQKIIEDMWLITKQALAKCQEIRAKIVSKDE